jgi:hypothetical protein
MDGKKKYQSLLTNEEVIRPPSVEEGRQSLFTSEQDRSPVSGKKRF